MNRRELIAGAIAAASSTLSAEPQQPQPILTSPINEMAIGSPVEISAEEEHRRYLEYQICSARHHEWESRFPEVGEGAEATFHEMMYNSPDRSLVAYCRKCGTKLVYHITMTEYGVPVERRGK